MASQVLFKKMGGGKKTHIFLTKIKAINIIYSMKKLKL